MIKVIGDIMLDRWILGTADRMSPEAPVPVLLENDQRYSIGGAGNLALNLGNLNVELSLHGSVGADKEGYKIIELLKDYTSITSSEVAKVVKVVKVAKVVKVEKVVEVVKVAKLKKVVVVRVVKVVKL